MTPMTPDEYIEKFDRGFATVAVVDTNGLLRGQLVSSRSLAGILENGMGMAPATLALDPTDEFLTLPGVTDGSADFHDDFLRVAFRIWVTSSAAPRSRRCRCCL